MSDNWCPFCLESIHNNSTQADTTHYPCGRHAAHGQCIQQYLEYRLKSKLQRAPIPPTAIPWSGLLHIYILCPICQGQFVAGTLIHVADHTCTVTVSQFEQPFGLRPWHSSATELFKYNPYNLYHRLLLDVQPYPLEVPLRLTPHPITPSCLEARAQYYLEVLFVVLVIVTIAYFFKLYNFIT
jgi:hypothetical protein